MAKVGPLFRSGGRRVARLIVIVACCYLAAGTYMYVFQRNFLYLPGGTLALPSERGLDNVQAVELVAQDGVRLSAWQADAGDDKPAVLYFHGNGGNISNRSDRFRRIIDTGYGLFAPGYRGYPGSGGAPSEEALIADGLLAFDRLKEQADEIVIYGESLGTAIAVAVAAERDAAALVLEAPFSAAIDIARSQYGWLPVGLLMKDQFLSRDRIGAVRAPVLIIHGDDDAIIPISQGQDLFSHAQEPREMRVITGGRHGDLWARGLWPAVVEFLDENLQKGG